MRKIFILIAGAVVSLIIFIIAVFIFQDKQEKFVNFDFQNKLILFYGRGCPHCANVENFIKENNVKAKILIEEREVYYNEENKNLLINLANKCGISSNKIGVPFLWDGINNECIMGDRQIISFLGEKIR
jgi:glutaredoxin